MSLIGLVRLPGRQAQHPPNLNLQVWQTWLPPRRPSQLIHHVLTLSRFPPHPLLPSASQEQLGVPTSPSLQLPPGSPAHPAVPSTLAAQRQVPTGLPSPPVRWPGGSHSTALFPREQCVCVTDNNVLSSRALPWCTLGHGTKGALCSSGM